MLQRHALYYVVAEFDRAEKWKRLALDAVDETSRAMAIEERERSFARARSLLDAILDDLKE